MCEIICRCVENDMDFTTADHERKSGTFFVDTPADRWILYTIRDERLLKGRLGDFHGFLI